MKLDPPGRRASQSRVSTAKSHRRSPAPGRPGETLRRGASAGSRPLDRGGRGPGLVKELTLDPHDGSHLGVLPSETKHQVADLEIETRSPRAAVWPAPLPPRTGGATGPGSQAGPAEESDRVLVASHRLPSTTNSRSRRTATYKVERGMRRGIARCEPHMLTGHVSVSLSFRIPGPGRPPCGGVDNEKQRGR